MKLQPTLTGQAPAIDVASVLQILESARAPAARFDSGHTTCACVKPLPSRVDGLLLHSATLNPIPKQAIKRTGP